METQSLPTETAMILEAEDEDLQPWLPAELSDKYTNQQEKNSKNSKKIK